MIVDSIHKAPIVRSILCRIGRHDFEAVSIEGGYVKLECFYCLHQRKSWIRERNDKLQW
jgi:hypothetical protein